MRLGPGGMKKKRNPKPETRLRLGVVKKNRIKKENQDPRRVSGPGGEDGGAGAAGAGAANDDGDGGGGSRCPFVYVVCKKLLVEQNKT